MFGFEGNEYDEVVEYTITTERRYQDSPNGFTWLLVAAWFVFFTALFWNA